MTADPFDGDHGDGCRCDPCMTMMFHEGEAFALDIDPDDLRAADLADAERGNCDEDRATPAMWRSGDEQDQR